MQFNGQKFSGLSEKLSFNPRFFLVKKAKICFLEEKRVWVKFISNLSAVGIKLVDFKKTPNTLNFD